MWLSENTEVLDSFPPQKWEVNTCSMWSCFTRCLNSLTISLVSSISRNDILTIGGKRLMDHTWLHASITQHMWTAAHALISSQNRLHMTTLLAISFVIMYECHKGIPKFDIDKTYFFPSSYINHYRFNYTGQTSSEFQF